MYEDPIGGPRKMVNCSDPLAHNKQLPHDGFIYVIFIYPSISAKFSIDKSKKSVTVTVGNKHQEVGDTLIYVAE